MARDACETFFQNFNVFETGNRQIDPSSRRRLKQLGSHNSQRRIFVSAMSVPMASNRTRGQRRTPNDENRDTPAHRAQALCRNARTHSRSRSADREEHRAVRLLQSGPDRRRQPDHRRSRPRRGRKAPRHGGRCRRCGCRISARPRSGPTSWPTTSLPRRPAGIARSWHRAARRWSTSISTSS